MKEIPSEDNLRKWKAEECRITRIAKNIKNILGYSMYKPNNDLIIIVFEGGPAMSRRPAHAV